jgi:tripartite-type tricarboxylate transporter receptor subunit TctC
MLSAIAAQAKENIVIYYSWGPGDVAAGFHRTLALESNKIQNKYNFIFDVKPGAGGTVAANYVLGRDNAVLATASAFFGMTFLKYGTVNTSNHTLKQFKDYQFISNEIHTSKT